jgi:hypothetical protein
LLWLLYVQESTMVPTEKEADWASESVWMFLRRGISFSSAGIHTPDCPACSIIIILIMLSLLQKLKYIGVKPSIMARWVIWPLQYF